MARRAKGSGFKMRSGNKTSFKQLGSSPARFTLGDDYRTNLKDAGAAAVDANEEFKEISNRNKKESPTKFGRGKKGGQTPSPSAASAAGAGFAPSPRTKGPKNAGLSRKKINAKYAEAAGMGLGKKHASQPNIAPQERPVRNGQALAMGKAMGRRRGKGGQRPTPSSQQSGQMANLKEQFAGMTPKQRRAMSESAGGGRQTVNPRLRDAMANAPTTVARGAQAASGAARPQVARKGGQRPVMGSAMAKKSPYTMKRGNKPSFKDLGS